MLLSTQSPSTFAAHNAVGDMMFANGQITVCNSAVLPDVGSNRHEHTPTGLYCPQLKTFVRPPSVISAAAHLPVDGNHLYSPAGIARRKKFLSAAVCRVVREPARGRLGFHRQRLDASIVAGSNVISTCDGGAGCFDRVDVSARQPRRSGDRGRHQRTHPHLQLHAWEDHCWISEARGALRGRSEVSALAGRQVLSKSKIGTTLGRNLQWILFCVL